MPYPSSGSLAVAASKGQFRGSPLHHSVAHFVKHYGPSAAHATIARLPEHFRVYVSPNAPALGILGARSYPYAFVGELVRTMKLVVHAPDEDLFVRELVYAGLDVTLSTMHRVLLRYLASPQMFLERRQEIWDLFHETGRQRIVSQTPHSYVIEDAEWPNTDATVCRINLEGRRRMLELVGVGNIEALREKCRAWGHPTCESRFRWT